MSVLTEWLLVKYFEHICTHFRALNITRKRKSHNRSYYDLLENVIISSLFTLKRQTKG